jgi:glucose/arabinose dehydrogenase
VRVFKHGALLATPFIDLSAQVNQVHDRGLLGVALDANFAANGAVYLLYTFEEGGNPNDPGPKTARLTRVTADPAHPDVALPGSEVVLVGRLGYPPCDRYPAGADCLPADELSHTIGTVRVAPDGTLFVGNGDGAFYGFANALALRAQDLDSYAGKLLRITPEGRAPGDNPFDDGTQSIRSKVWASGLRNPFRFALDPQTGEPYIGDVGWDA